MVAPEGLVGRVLNDTYRIEELLGEGGMGVVYKALHMQLGRLRAIKVLHPSVAADHEGLEQFKQEARITSGLGHPNVTQVFDFHHTPDGIHYMVMELLKGEDLADRIRKKKRLELSETVVIFEQVTSVLQAVHDQGIIHCDLKPKNIFLCSSDDRPDLVKLLDFGISRVIGKKIADLHTAGLVGTPAYMAPEQVEHGTTEAVGPETDVYSLGAILYEMLAGKPPFSAENVPALLYQIVNERLPSLRRLRPDVPADIASVIKKSLRKSKSRRYSSVENFWQEFYRACALNLRADSQDTVDDSVLITVTRGGDTTQ